MFDSKSYEIIGIIDDIIWSVKLGYTIKRISPYYRITDRAISDIQNAFAINIAQCHIICAVRIIIYYAFSVSPSYPHSVQLLQQPFNFLDRVGLYRNNMIVFILSP